MGDIVAVTVVVATVSVSVSVVVVAAAGGVAMALLATAARGGWVRVATVLLMARVAVGAVLVAIMSSPALWQLAEIERLTLGLIRFICCMFLQAGPSFLVVGVRRPPACFLRVEALWTCRYKYKYNSN